MILGIDASRALTDAPTGTEYYSRALIDALLRLDMPARFRLYTRATPPPNFFPPTKNYEIRAMPFPRLWTHVRLSFEMLTRPPDALFVPAHVLPPVHPRHSIVTVHDLGYRYFPDAHGGLARLYLDWSTRWNVNAARIVVADSYATRDDIVKFYGARARDTRVAEKIRVVYPCYNAQVFKPTREASERARVRQKYTLGENYVISVGTLHPRKNYARLVEAFANLPAGYSLVLVGKKGGYADSLTARVRELNLDRRVKFLDYAPIQDLPALYAGAGCAVFPSLYEGFGFPALEAQACETALVCANTSSLPEVAGDAAEYFDPTDVNAMACAIRKVLENAARREELIVRGRANVKRFSWERAAREMLEIVSAF